MLLQCAALRDDCDVDGLPDAMHFQVEFSE